METIVRDILAALRELGEALNEKQLISILHAHNKGKKPDELKYAKKHLMPYYRRIKQEDRALWESWNIDPDLEELFLQTIRVKPRRTASGVATITLITKPWPCKSSCLYCPNDLRMPKSYLSNEPACQRAEQHFFDPYLQVLARLHALENMGHTTDKLEIIILGGTWSDYPRSYQTWFMYQIFKALNDCSYESFAYADECARKRCAFYERAGISCEKDKLAREVFAFQERINRGELSYNQAFREYYLQESPWLKLHEVQSATLDELSCEHERNVDAAHRVVGLVVETRPDAVDEQELKMLRRYGCTKIQMGIQSLQEEVLRKNTRNTSLEGIKRAFELLRLYGFKLHIHFMANLLGSSEKQDLEDYYELVSNPHYLPDELKLYPCLLVESSELCAEFEKGNWKPYDEESLIELLAACVVATPPYTRISRMIRDISSQDIMAGSKKTNLRQLVENKLLSEDNVVDEIRFREISTAQTDRSALACKIYQYATSVSDEYFLQWVDTQGRIAGFLRLSLPYEQALAAYPQFDAVKAQEAMIREVHIYGSVVQLDSNVQDSRGRAQHIGLGKSLIEKACRIAAEAGYTKLNVISAIGTRSYYRRQGFCVMTQDGLYQQRDLVELPAQDV